MEKTLVCKCLHLNNKVNLLTISYHDLTMKTTSKAFKLISAFTNTLLQLFSYLFIFKGIVHFEIKIWYVSAYPKGIQDVGVFFSSVDPILMFLGQNVLVCQSYNGRYRSLSL